MLLFCNSDDETVNNHDTLPQQPVNIGGIASDIKSTTGGNDDDVDSISGRDDHDVKSTSDVSHRTVPASTLPLSDNEGLVAKHLLFYSSSLRMLGIDSSMFGSRCSKYIVRRQLKIE